MHVCDAELIAHALNPPVAAGSVAESKSVLVHPVHVPELNPEQCHFSRSADGVPESARTRISATWDAAGTSHLPVIWAAVRTVADCVSLSIVQLRRVFTTAIAAEFTLFAVWPSATTLPVPIFASFPVVSTRMPFAVPPAVT
jgi:hypothetical protein